jgi:2-dehydro-3-deoxygluconokinase
MKITICSIGECMIEITNVEKELYNYSVAGDTLNFTSYLDQSIFNKFYLTAIGTSDINKGVINFLKKKKINTDLVKKISSKEIGLYLIKNTKRGEKKFYYWRDDSAANFFFNNINKSLFKKKYNFDYIYLTGITLSLLDFKNIDKFIMHLANLRKKNSKIIFDFNIRIKRWSKKNLNLYLNKILSNIDILFCSGEDLVCWKNNDHIKTLENILKKFNIYHAIYRKNEEYNYSFFKNKKFMIKNKPIKKVVDTSGAGDGYNAAYLSNFIISNNPQLALNEASKIGAKIVMKKGAIVNVK